MLGSGSAEAAALAQRDEEAKKGQRRQGGLGWWSVVKEAGQQGHQWRRSRGAGHGVVEVRESQPMSELAEVTAMAWRDEVAVKEQRKQGNLGRDGGGEGPDETHPSSSDFYLAEQGLVVLGGLTAVDELDGQG